MLVPAIGLVVMCGLISCGDDEMAAFAIDVRVDLPRAQLSVDDTATVRVVATNKGKKTWTIPTQDCLPSIRVHEYLGPDEKPGPLVYPSLNFICVGESVAGATLAPGDSLVLKSDLMASIITARKALNLPLDGQYLVYGRLKFEGLGSKLTSPVILTVTPKP